MPNSDSTRPRVRRSATFRQREIVTAIIVDGGFYRRRARALFGEKTPECRAEELLEYCRRHIRESRGNLYRIYYYDCPPSDKVIYHPLTQRQVNLRHSDEYAWMTSFLQALVKKRKVALRRGEELETQSGYLLKATPLKKLLRGSITISDLTEQDFSLDITQKGVDMRIDFILDPLWARVTDSLNEHVDGVRQCVKRVPDNEQDPLHALNQAPTGQTSPDEESCCLTPGAPEP